ncbi:MAG: HD domain-containing protein [Sphaerochaetaceae bacterium]|nr:HD domain-containing protein [Sphaerochaetaceae bacterium]
MHNMKDFPITETIKQFASKFVENGFKLYIVGGAVRDHLLHIENDDFDFTTDATPQNVIQMFKKTIPTGLKHGTVTVLFKGEAFEVTTFRSESDYLDGRHPDTVSYVKNLEEDLKRRDFTINALAADAVTGKIIDMHDGIGDIKRKVIKAIGIPEERIKEDGLRIMRACRFASKLDFEVESETFDAMVKNQNNIRSVSNERIREELYKMLKGMAPVKGLNLLYDCGLMDIVLPEIACLKGVTQGGRHTDDVFDHTLKTVEAAKNLEYPLNIRIAALFHDCGKKQTQELDPTRGDDSYSFFQHEIVGSKICAKTLRRLKDSNENIKDISNLVKNHMFAYIPSWSDGAVRRFINRVGRDSINDLFKLRMCDIYAMSGKADWSHVEALESRIKQILIDCDALSVKDLDINGKDLMDLGIPRGPMFSRILNYLLETVLDDPNQNKKEQLKVIASNFYEEIK